MLNESHVKKSNDNNTTSVQKEKRFVSLRVLLPFHGIPYLECRCERACELATMFIEVLPDFCCCCCCCCRLSRLVYSYRSSCRKSNRKVSREKPKTGEGRQISTIPFFSLVIFLFLSFFPFGEKGGTD